MNREVSEREDGQERRTVNGPDGGVVTVPTNVSESMSLEDIRKYSKSIEVAGKLALQKMKDKRHKEKQLEKIRSYLPNGSIIHEDEEEYSSMVSSRAGSRSESRKRR